MNRIIVLILAFLLLLTGCGTGNDQLNSIESSDVTDKSLNLSDTLSLPLTNIKTLNPLLADNWDYFQFSHLIYDSLFVIGQEGRIEPSIAEHYEFSKDNHVLSVTIRDNIFWHDGVKLTSQDVADSFNALKRLPPSSAYYQMLKSNIGGGTSFDIENFGRAVVFDERNIDFEFDKPYGNILNMMIFPILPSHKMSQEDMVSEENFEVLGTGPYKLNSYKPNQEIGLIRNANYYGNVPYVEKINGKIFESKSYMLQAFEAGQVQLLSLDDYTWDKYRSNPSIEIEPYATNRLELISINTQKDIFSGKSGIALRRALARGINKNRIIDSIYLGQATPTSFFINPESNGGIIINNIYHFNVESSKKILNEAGFKDTNGDGWLEQPNGESFTLRLLTNSSNQSRKIAADLIVEDIRTLGIRCIIDNPEDTLSEEEDFKRLLSKMQTMDYDLALYGINFSFVPDIARLLHSKYSSNTNTSHYKNQQMDFLLEELAFVNDMEEKNLVYNKINDLFLEESPYIPLLFKQNVLMRNGKIEQDLNPDIYNIYRYVNQISVPN